MSGEKKAWDVYGTYQEGKMKRYGLLFSVNGGAYAVVTWKAEHPDNPLGASASLTNIAVVVALTASLLSALMFVDIWLFGRMMRQQAPKDELVYFGPHGKAVLTSIVLVLGAAWTALLIPTMLWSLAAVPALAIAAAIVWIAVSAGSSQRAGSRAR